MIWRWVIAPFGASAVVVALTRGLRAIEDGIDSRFVFLQGPIIQIRGIVNMLSFALVIDFDVQHPF